MTLPHVIEAVLGLGLASLLAWRLYRLPRVIRSLPGYTAPQALLASPALTVIKGGLPPTGHMVFAQPLEHNEHGFITSPLVACSDPNCPCRSFPSAIKN